MPDPISSRVDDPYRPYSAGEDDDLVCKDPAETTSNVENADATRASNESGVRPPPSREPGIARFGAEAHADHDDLYAGAFALKGRDETGAEVEVFSVSAHKNDRETVLQVGMARMGLSSDNLHWSARAEAFTAQARNGFDNPDGSYGYNVSAGFTVVGAEGTATIGALSVTGALSVGTTFGFSGGVRDSDDDGQIEYCARVDLGAGGLGFCLEDRW